MDGGESPTELRDIRRCLEERVCVLERCLAEKNELIENMTSKLDQYQSVVGHIASSASVAGGGRRKQRAYGISAEPHRDQQLSSQQHPQPKNVFFTYPKSQRSVGQSVGRYTLCRQCQLSLLLLLMHLMLLMMSHNVS